MTDLRDIAILAFADDGTVCLIVAALASLLVGRKMKPGIVATLAFLACWAAPYVFMIEAHGRPAAVEAVSHAVAALPSDAIWLVVRYCGMLLTVTLLWRARLALHGQRSITQVQSKAA